MWLKNLQKKNKKNRIIETFNGIIYRALCTKAEEVCMVLGYKTIESCGLIVFNGNHVLLIKRNGEWDLPKGRHEEGEQYRQTALRETDEETGIRQIDLEIVAELFPTQHFTEYDGVHHIKTTHWFMAKYRGPIDHVLIPQTDEGIEDVQWVSLNTVNQYLPEMRGYARYILDSTLNLLKIEQKRLKEKLTRGD